MNSSTMGTKRLKKSVAGSRMMCRNSLRATDTARCSEKPTRLLRGVMRIAIARALPGAHLECGENRRSGILLGFPSPRKEEKAQGADSHQHNSNLALQVDISLVRAAPSRSARIPLSERA